MNGFRGLFSVLATPFDDDLRLDAQSLRHLVRFKLAAGASGLVALGVMGEAAQLDDEERARVMQVVVAEVAGDVPVVVGISDHDSGIAAARAVRACELGAAALMLAVPAEVERLVPHLEAVARAAPGVPLVLQDYPKSGHPPVTAEQLVEAARAVPAVSCLKAEDPPTADKIAAVHALAPALPQLGGLSGLWSLWELEAGSSGCMTGFAVPELLVALTAAAADGDWEHAGEIYRTALPALVWESQPGAELALRKALLVARGVIASPAQRAPSPPVAGAPAAAQRLLAELNLGLTTSDRKDPR
jgi:4-hydroxy-tetrahydrodipicolinate synthase